MALRLVRCPFCRQRFNVADAPPGSRLQCSLCAANLTVPPARAAPQRKAFFPERRGTQVALAAGLAVVLAGAAYLLLRSDRPAKDSPPVAEVPGPRPEPPRIDPFVHPGRDPWFKQVPRVRDLILQEFSPLKVSTKEAYPWLIAVQDGPRIVQTDIMDDYARRLTELERLFRREFAEPLNLPVVADVLPVIVLNSRASYDEYCLKRHDRLMPPEIPGMYEYSRRRIVLYHDLWAPYEVVLHEGTHQLIHHYSVKKREPVNSYWFQEGMGTYFEGFRRLGGEVVLDPRVHRGRLPTVKKALEEGTFVPLRRLVAMSTEDFWTWFNNRQEDPEARAKLAQLYYAQSWALVYFLLHAEEGRYRPAFLQYFRDELAAEGSAERFERALRHATKTDLTGLEAAFVDYIRKLE